MPEPVFIKGYLRAYAKLLSVPPDPLLEIFTTIYSSDKKLEKALWQSKQRTNKGERLVRVLTVWGGGYCCYCCGGFVVAKK